MEPGFKVAAMVLLGTSMGTSMGFRGKLVQLLSAVALISLTEVTFTAGDDLMDAKPSLLALTPVVRCVPVPMQVVTW